MASDLKADQRTAAVILAPLALAMFIAPVLVAVGQGSNTPQPAIQQAK